ncbi:kinase-like protein [Xylariaceae sp. FL1019]|nr:kinase-like protein [Xylariaceae sp. FL1019]
MATALDSFSTLHTSTDSNQANTTQWEMTAALTPDLGYYVDSDDECEVESECEPVLRYFEDCWYCPLRIGKVVGGKIPYRIEHKLGHGGFSTVWLARNLFSQQLVALKVLSIHWRAEEERRMNHEISQRTGGDEAAYYLITSQDSFYVKGRNALPHLVLVLPWRGPSLNTECFHLPPSFRVPGAKDLLQALARLHVAGVVHSDINPGAAMWHIASLDRLETTELYGRLSRPRKVLQSEECGGGELVEPLHVPRSMLRPSLCLADFGHSFVSGTVLEDQAQSPMIYCAPERLHGVHPSFASDVWSFTQILAKLYLGIEITYGNGTKSVSRLVAALGPLPTHWRGSFFAAELEREWWYDQTCTLPRDPDSSYESLEHKIDRLRPGICAEERRLALDVFRKGFEYSPEKRITAAHLLSDPSFNALMAYY